MTAAATIRCRQPPNVGGMALAMQEQVMDLWTRDAGAIAALVHSGEVSAREVVAAHLDRIEEINPSINAVTVVLAEEALSAAEELDQRLRRGERPPLAGVPITVKENVDVRGSATTLGIRALQAAVAERDAPHVAQLRAAGAVVVGRTNMPEFGMRWHTDNELRGVTRNPWSAAHTAGGSSGGDAAAVASGMAVIGIGNDGAGSLRWPAQCCGIASLKPSFGRIGNAATLPTPFAFQLLAVHGPLARTVSDLRLAFEHMCAPVPDDPWQVPADFGGPPAPRRVWRLAESDETDVDPHVAEALSLAGSALRDAGYEVIDGSAPELTRAMQIYLQLMTRFGRIHDNEEPVANLTSAAFARFWELLAPEWERASGEPAFDPLSERTALFRKWAAWTRDVPLVLAPIATRPAFAIDDDLNDEWARQWPAVFRHAVVPNLLGLPAAAIPTGQQGDLPGAVQLIGPRLREDLCLAAAEAIEARLGAPSPVNPFGRPTSEQSSGAAAAQP